VIDEQWYALEIWKTKLFYSPCCELNNKLTLTMMSFFISVVCFY